MPYRIQINVTGETPQDAYEAARDALDRFALDGLVTGEREGEGELVLIEEGE